MSGARYLGMREGDLAGKPYAKYWRTDMRPLSAVVSATRARGPGEGASAPALDEAPALFREQDGEQDRGPEAEVILGRDGALHVAVRTPMPDTTPAMVDWWFGWHGEEPQRYKLWHPRAHLCAEWREPRAAGARGREAYVGRPSYVDEYVGPELAHIVIRFVDPVELGFDAADFADPERATVVCARVGLARAPLEFGWLMHHVRRTAGGSVMSSRFWMGGAHVGGRGGSRLGALAARALSRVVRPGAGRGRALLVHCSEEMTHLASFLPRLHGELGAR